MGKPLFPGKSVVHQLDLITDLLGTPSSDTISGVRNEKARKYLMEMRKKSPVNFSEKFRNADPLALKLLKRMLAFDPKDRPSAEQALADPYFKGLAKIEREPACQPLSKLEFEFERRRVTKEDVRELIFREILEYHPQLLKDFMAGNGGPSYLYPSAVGHFKKQFTYLEENVAASGSSLERKHVSLPRSTVNSSTIPPKTQQTGASSIDNGQILGQAFSGHKYADPTSRNASNVSQPQTRLPTAKQGPVVGPVLPYANNLPHEPRSFLPHCSNKCQERNRTEPEKEISTVSHQTPAKANTINITPQNTSDAMNLHGKSQFVVAHREAGVVQIGL